MYNIILFVFAQSAWPGNSLTAAISFCLLIAWSSFILLDRGSLIRVLDWPQTSLVFYLFRWSCLRWLPMTSLLTTEGMFTVWSEETPCPYLGQCQFISFLISCYSVMSRYPYWSDFIGFTQFSWRLRTDPCQSRFGGGFLQVLAAITALLSEQVCVLLVTFPGESSSVHLRTAITSTGNTVERLPIGLVSLWLSLGP